MPDVIGMLTLFFKELFIFVSYVKNNAFPQPLSEESLGLMAKGDTVARNRLIEHNLRLVAHIVKRI